MLRCRMLQLIFLIFGSGPTACRSRRDVALENLVLRHQLQVALRTTPAPRLRSPDRVLWVWVRQLWPGWRDHLLIVKPATVIRYPLAPQGLAPLLDLEVTDRARASSPERRGSRAHRHHVRR
jgi:hypothetical protein